MDTIAHSEHQQYGRHRSSHGASSFSQRRSAVSGFDTGLPGTSVPFMAKQFGPILRGFGPPVPQACVVGELYIDNVTFELFEKREINGLDAWGHYLWIVPTLYRTTLKWF